MEIADTAATMLQSVYDHASWANTKLFDTAAQISEAQLTHAAGDSESIFALLLHLVDVQRTWLARAQLTVAPPLDQAACATLAKLRETWKSVDDASRIYIDTLRTDDLGEVVHYTNLKGEPQAYPRWQ